MVMTESIWLDFRRISAAETVVAVAVEAARVGVVVVVVRPAVVAALRTIVVVETLFLVLTSADGVDVRLVVFKGSCEAGRRRRSVGVDRIGDPPSNSVDAGR